MLLVDAPLTLREFVTSESLPLATIFREVLGFLASRPDAVVFGAHAVNAYCEPERMTADIDILSPDASRLADDVRAFIGERFHIAVRVREVASRGFRVYQLRQPKNRHLVDVRQVDRLPVHRVFEGVQVLEPTELLAMKVLSMVARKDREKGLSDRLDVHRLLRAFPELRTDTGDVTSRLRALGADEAVLVAWADVVSQMLAPDGNDDVDF